MSSARRFVVHGRVQGVGYRFFTETSAGALGIRGWVRNLPDGSVEVHAEGTPEQLAEFASDLSRGPRYARVSSVDATDVPPEGFGDFRLLR